MISKEQYEEYIRLIGDMLDGIISFNQKRFDEIADAVVQYEKANFPMQKPSKMNAWLFRIEQESGDQRAMFDKISKVIRAYRQEYRKYHNLSHIESMMELAATCGWPLSQAQHWAIFYHDVVYDIPAGTVSNEELSAQWYLKDWGGIHSFAHITAQIIRDTRLHVPTIEESKVVIDLDLDGLSSPALYDKNKDLIRAEFSVYTDEQFKSGRIKFLEGQLAKDRIFWYKDTVSKDFMAKFLMQKELESLKEQ